ncbi:hypothetical protein ACIBK9_47435 [Nonomuraea sp. NPDC050227]|uniref:hypothetical protein n=1 Tax=Nonomuraea sp. NPDC050227 TaxID=3364360 RepID=UPI0037B04F3A
MKPGGPLKRYTELKAKSPMKRGKGFKAAGEAIKRKAGPQTAPKAVIDIVKERSDGACEIGLKCFGCAPATETPHRRGKGSGGVGRKNSTSNVASNLLRGCAACHDLIDDVAPADAARIGLKVLHGVAHPYEIPVRHWRFGWVLLDNEGGYRPAPIEACTPGDLLPVIAVDVWDLIQQNGAFIEAMERFGHLQCPGWSTPRVGLFTCGCGSTPFYLEEVA